MNRKALSKMASVFIVFMMVATSFAVVVSYDEDANNRNVSDTGSFYNGTVSADPPQQPGELSISKKAQKVSGTTNQWDITLELNGKNKQERTDVVFVIDTSRSMEMGTGRMQAAKDAANTAIGILIPTSGAGNIKAAVVSFASTAVTVQELTNNKVLLKEKVDNLIADGGTFTQGGIHVASDILDASTAKNKFIVLLSDGLPTFAYKVNSYSIGMSEVQSKKQLYYLEGSNWYKSNNKYTYKETLPTMPKSNMNYASGAFGCGKDAQSAEFSSSQPWTVLNSSNQAIAEAGFFKNPVNPNKGIYAVGLSLDSEGQAVMNAIDSSGTAQAATNANLTSIFSTIANKIAFAAKNATITDPMGSMFSVVGTPLTAVTITDKNNNAVPGASVAYNASTETYTFTIPEVSENLSPIKIKYRVVLDGTNPGSGLHSTNGTTTINYTDSDGNPASKIFPDVPSVGIGATSINRHYVLINDADQLLNTSGPQTGGQAMDLSAAQIKSEYWVHNSSTSLPAAIYSVTAPASFVLDGWTYNYAGKTSVTGTTSGTVSINSSPCTVNTAYNESSQVYFSYYKVNKATITFQSNNGTSQTSTQQVELNVETNLKALNTMGFTVPSGYMFDKWTGNGGEYADEASITATSIDAITLTAQWKKDTSQWFDIIYDGNGATSGTAPATVNVMPGTYTLAGNPGNLAINGYTFKGWADSSGSSTVIEQVIIVAADVTVYAIWAKTTSMWFSVTYDGNGNTGGDAPTDADTYMSGTSVTSKVAGDLSKTGYTFNGWNSAAAGTGDITVAAGSAFTMPGSNVTLYAQWTLNTYTITATAGPNGSISPSGSVTANHGSDYTFTFSPNTGYQVDQVKVNGFVIINPSTSYSITNVTENKTIEVTFKKDSIMWFSVTYNGNENTGGTAPADANTYMANATVTSKAASGLTRTGYAFGGWNSAANGSGTITVVAGGTFTMPSSNVTLYAKWTANTYDATFKGNFTGSSYSVTVSQTYGQNTVMPDANPERAGYTLASWNTATDGMGTTVSSSTIYATTGNSTYYAQWTANNDISYTVTYKSTGGAVLSPAKTVTGKTMATEVSENALAIAGWTVDSATKTLVLAATDNLIAFVYTANNDISYTVTYKSTGGAVLSPAKTVTGKTMATEVSENALAIAGWTVDSATKTLVLAATDNLIAFVYTANNDISYTVTYKSTGGAVLSPAKTVTGKTMATEVSENALAIAGWTVDSATKTLVLAATDNLIAFVYTANNDISYTVTYKSTGGAVLSPAKTVTGKTMATEVSENALAIAGWTVDSATKTLVLAATDNLIAFVYTANNDISYTVTYKSTGGAVLSPAKTVTGKTMATEVSENALAIAGWTVDSATKTLVLAATDNLIAFVYTANNDISYTVTYKSTGGAVLSPAKTVTGKTMATEVSENALAIAGWTVDSATKTLVLAATDNLIAFVYTANNDISYTVTYKSTGGAVLSPAKTVTGKTMATEVSENALAIAGWTVDSATKTLVLAATDNLIAFVYTANNDISYTVTYKSTGGAVLSPAKTVTGKTMATEVSENALAIAGWTVDSATKTLVLAATDNLIAFVYTANNDISYTVTYKSTGGAVLSPAKTVTGKTMATEVSENALAIAGWTVDSATKTLVLAATDNLIAFVYTANNDISYTVTYKSTGGAVLSPAKTVSGKTMATEVSENALSIAGWTVDSATKTLVLAATDNLIAFVYTANNDISYTVTYKSTGGAVLSPAKTVTGKTMATEVSENALAIAGWTVDSATKTLVLAATDNLIAFVYTANNDISYTVTYKSTGGAVLSPAKTVTGKTMATEVSENALAIAGWTVDSATKTLVLAATDNLIAFVYTANNDISYTVTYKSTGGAVLSPAKTVSGKTMATEVSENALSIAGWTVDSATKTLVLAATDNLIAFVYTANNDISYTVTYKSTGGAVLSPAKTVSGKTMATEVSENALSIAGWTVDSATKTLVLAATDNLIAFVYTANTYTATFTGNYTGSLYSESVSQTFAQNTVLPVTNPTRAGYTFASWNTAADGSGTTVTSTTLYATADNSTYYAKWTADSCTVSYSVTGKAPNGWSVPANQTTYTDASFTAASVTVPAGYTFSGWKISGAGEVVTTFNVPVGGAELKGVWNATDYTVTYTVSGTGPASSEYTVPGVTTHNAGYTYTVADKLAVYGWNFIGWKNGTDTVSGSQTMPAANVVLTSTWVKNDGPGGDWAKVTFDKGAHGEFVTGAVTSFDVRKNMALSGEGVTAPGITAEYGWIFDGFQGYAAGNTVTADTTYTAQYKKNDGSGGDWVKVTFDKGAHGEFAAGAVTSFDVRKNMALSGEGVTAPGITAEYGWIFDGFQGYAAGNTVTADTTYTAKYVENPAQWADITFLAGNHGTLNGTATFHVKTNVLMSTITAPTPVPEYGYQFTDWSPVIVLTANAATKTYTAQWEEKSSEWADITFLAGNHGTLTGTTTFHVKTNVLMSTITAPTPVPEYGYQFTDWSPVIVLTANAATKTYTAQWEEKSSEWADITFLAGNHGTLTGTTTFHVKTNVLMSTITAPTPVPEYGYQFTDWSPVIVLTANAATKTYTAQWEEKSSEWADITFLAGNHGTLTGTTTFHVKTNVLMSTITAPTPVPEYGYQFTDWSPVIVLTANAATKTYTAQWTVKADEWAKVTFDKGAHGEFVTGSTTSFDVRKDRALSDEGVTAPIIDPEYGWVFTEFDGYAGTNKVFADTTYTAQYVKNDGPGGVWVKVTFDKGAHGEFVTGSTTSFDVRKDRALSDEGVIVPGITPENGWIFDGFQGYADTNKVFADTTYTAQYTGVQYHLVLTSSNVTVTGITTGQTVTHGTDVTFTVTANSGYRAVSVTVTMNGTTTTLAPVNGTYTIVGDSILSDVTVNATARPLPGPSPGPVEKYYNVTASYDPNYVVVNGIPETKVVKENSLLSVTVSQATVPVKVLVTVTMGGVPVQGAFVYDENTQSSGVVTIAAVTGDVKINVYYEIIPAENPTDDGGFPWWILLVIAIVCFILLLIYYRRRKEEEDEAGA